MRCRRYAWSIASTQIDGGPVEYSHHPEFMLQPPWDAELSIEGEPACIIHYTYGNDFDEAGKLTAGKIGHWHWDKRDYMVSLLGLAHSMLAGGELKIEKQLKSRQKSTYSIHVYMCGSVRRTSTLPSTSPCRQRVAPTTR